MIEKRESGLLAVVPSREPGSMIHLPSQTEAVSEAIDRCPNPERVARSLAGIRQSAGAWQGLVDADSLKAYVRERRRTATRSPLPE